jgi:hypothetical protein
VHTIAHAARRGNRQGIAASRGVRGPDAVRIAQGDRMRIVCVLAVCSIAACHSSAGEPRDLPEARVAIVAEAALQATVRDGPPDVFVAAADHLRDRFAQLARRLEHDAAWHDLHAQLIYASDVLGSVGPHDGVGDDAAARQVVAQRVHEHVTRLPLRPLPYPPDAALSQRDAAEVAEEPHSAGEALFVFTEAADVACACHVRACRPDVDDLFEHVHLTYGDSDGPDQVLRQVGDQLHRFHTCDFADPTR